MDSCKTDFLLASFILLLSWTISVVEARRPQRQSNQDITCKGRHGYFPDERDCSRYYLCFGGRKRTFNCVRGSTFVVPANRCVQNTTCPQVRAVEPEEPRIEFCNDGYRRYGDMCYKMFPAFATWQSANTSCANNSAVLAQARSKNVLHFLMRLSRFYNARDFWISTENMGSAIQNMTTLRRRKGAIAVTVQRHILNYLCVKLSYFHGYKLTRAMCQNQNGFICQKQFNSSTTAPPRNEKPMQQSNCVNGPQTEAIIGGRNAKSSHYPWMVSLQRGHKHLCGATLINRCWLLSAAHCLSMPFIQPSDMPTHAVFGWNAADRRLHSSILLGTIILHPTFAAHPVPTNDIALIKLKHCTSKFRPICPTGPDLPVSNLRCHVLGFGATDASGRIINNQQSLQILSMPLIDDTTCRSSYRDRFNNLQTYITDTMFCAGYLEGGRDSCRGDSGGPLICEDQVTRSTLQWGIVSWGGGCAIQNKPGVYAKVSAFHSWIQNTTRFV